MQTITQIAKELGYSSAHTLRWKMKSRGSNVQLIPYCLGEDGKTHFYDHEAAEYIKQIAGVSVRGFKEVPVKRLVVRMKDSAQDQVQDSSVTRMHLPDVKSMNFDQRVQQIKVLGELLSQQIETLNRDFAAVNRSMAS